jgi:hypothetical protein
MRRIKTLPSTPLASHIDPASCIHMLSIEGQPGILTSFPLWIPDTDDREKFFLSIHSINARLIILIINIVKCGEYFGAFNLPAGLRIA